MQGDYFDRQVRQARADGIRRQAAADAIGGGLEGTDKASTNVYGYSDTQTPIYGNAARRDVTEDDRHNPILGNEGHALLDFWDGIRATDKGTRFNGQYSRGGIGTFPGGQSTGGQREMEGDKEWNHKYVRPLTANQKIMAGEMRHQVWGAMAPDGADKDGGCKDAETSEKAADCVAKVLLKKGTDAGCVHMRPLAHAFALALARARAHTHTHTHTHTHAQALKLDASRDLDKQAINMASREWRALRRPGSEVPPHPLFARRLPKLRPFLPLPPPPHPSLSLPQTIPSLSHLVPCFLFSVPCLHSSLSFPSLPPLSRKGTAKGKCQSLP